MKVIPLPYHTAHLDLRVAEKNLEAVVNARIHGYEPGASEERIARNALEAPIGTPRLRELARGRRRVVLVTSDHTRAMPSKITLPLLLAEIRAGNPEADVTILIGTGLHRPTTPEEQRRMFGDAIADREKILVNDAFKPEEFVSICKLPSGAEFKVHKLAARCDLLVAEGFIEPHFFAGFSGGRKSILPGICPRETVSANHSFKAVAHPRAAAGILQGNPIHEDMLVAARAVNTAFILNVALNADKKIIAAFAGDMEKAHEAGCGFIRELSQCPAGIAGDIVVTSNGGYPLDQNLYQTAKAVSTAEACAAPGAVIIMCASCSDGMGGEYFEKIITDGTAEEIERKLAEIPPGETIPEQWNAQVYVRALKKHPIILVSTFLDHALARKANLIPASSPDEALSLAYAMRGENARVVVIPDGVAVLAVRT
jgi:nickel-dependent lactate racemase